MKTVNYVLNGKRYIVKLTEFQKDVLRLLCITKGLSMNAVMCQLHKKANRNECGRSMQIRDLIIFNAIKCVNVKVLHEMLRIK